MKQKELEYTIGIDLAAGHSLFITSDFNGRKLTEVEAREVEYSIREKNYRME